MLKLNNKLIVFAVGILLLWPFTVAAQITNTGAVGEVVSAESFDGSIIAFCTLESEVGVDLNGDGDMIDHVIRYFDVSTGTIIDTDAVGYEPAICGNIIAFLTRENKIGFDLNEDGDTDDSVVRYYDILTGITTNTGEEGYDLAVDGGIIAFTVAEAQIGVDLNEDEDTNDRFIQCYDVSTGTTIDTGVAGAYSSKSGNIIAFETLETWVSNDLNGDGDTNDWVVRYYDMSTGIAINTSAVGYAVSVDGNIIAFYTCEWDINLDLNEDGDTDDSVVRYYDILTGITTNTGADGEWPSVDGGTIAFETYEPEVDADLNGDGDSDDIVIRYYDTSTGIIRIAGVGQYASKENNIIAFYTCEWDINLDLNGDEDKDDTIVRYYVISAPTIESCDSNGNKKDIFGVGETVYVNGSGYSPDTIYALYVVNDVGTWSGARVYTVVLAITATSDSLGNIPVTPVWSPPLTYGKFDILVDVYVNISGPAFDAGIDALDDLDIDMAGFIVIPENRLGIFICLAGCLAAFSVYLMVDLITTFRDDDKSHARTISNVTVYW